MDIQECIENALQKALLNLFAQLGDIAFSAKIDKLATLELLRKKYLLTPAEVFALYGIPTATLATWRSRHQGPDYTKAESSVFYTHKQIERWIAANEVKIKP